MAKDIIIDENRGFQGVWIPKNLYMTNKFSARTKFFLVEVKSLSKNGYCYATDKHFSDFLGISERMVQNIINDLKKRNYLRTEYDYDGNTKAIKRRFLILTQTFYDEFYNEKEEKEGTEKNFGRGTEKKCGEKYNNKVKYNNNKKYSVTSPHDSDCDNEILSKAKSITNDNTILGAIDYYLKKYKTELGRVHPDITYASLSNIISNIINILDESDNEIIADNGLSKMINRHFDTNYGQAIDYKLQHFGSEGILEYQARNCGYICGINE